MERVKEELTSVLNNISIQSTMQQTPANPASPRKVKKRVIANARIPLTMLRRKSSTRPESGLPISMQKDKSLLRKQQTLGFGMFNKKQFGALASPADQSNRPRRFYGKQNSQFQARHSTLAAKPLLMDNVSNRISIGILDDNSPLYEEDCSSDSSLGFNMSKGGHHLINAYTSSSAEEESSQNWTPPDILGEDETKFMNKVESQI